MSNNNNNWKRIGGFSRTGTQNYVRTNDAAMGGTTFGGSTDVSYNTGNTTHRIGNNAGVIFINGDIDMSGGQGVAAPINRVRNVRDPIDNQDVATKYYVDRTVASITRQLDISMGPTGQAGPPGIGIPGDNGSDGIPGPTGPTGPRGPKGDTEGVVGPAGPTGQRGATGANGAAGATGPVGPAGSKGEQGTQGTQGAQGSNGTILWLNPDGDSISDILISDSYMLSQFPIQSKLRTIGPISASATYGNINKMIPVTRFWNTASKISPLVVIPSGIWVLNLYAAAASNSDARQISLYAAIFMITGTENQPMPNSLIIESKEGGDPGFYPPRAQFLPDHIKYIGRSWETTNPPINTGNILDNTTGKEVNSTSKTLYKIEMPVDFVSLKDANGNSNNVYVQLQIYAKNTLNANQTANVLLYYQTDNGSLETTYSYLQTTFGAVGSIGPIGSTGPVGSQGAAGSQGEKGPAGPTGSIGPTGNTGPIGPRGFPGPVGNVGPAGQSNSFGPQYSVQYRGNTALSDTDPSGNFGGTRNFRYDVNGFTSNMSDASMGTVVMNDLACRSIHSSFYVEDPSINSSNNTRPRTFIKGGEAIGNYIVLASGINNTPSEGGLTKSPATINDITHGVKLIHNFETNPPTVTFNLHNNNDKTSAVVGMKLDLTNGNIIAAQDKFCVINTNGAVGVGGITPNELTALGSSNLRRMLHVSGNVMVGTNPGSANSLDPSSAMIMFNRSTTTPTSLIYPGLYHREVIGSSASAIGLQDSSGGLGITAPNFITFQTGNPTQNNSIVINQAGNVSVLGRTNLNGRVGIGKNFDNTSSHASVQSLLDISGITHLTSAATTFGTDNPRIKLISNAIQTNSALPAAGTGTSETANEIRGVNSGNTSGFLRLTAQTAQNSCIDLIGINTLDNSRYSNSVRFITSGSERMIIDLSGNVGIGTTQLNPTSRVNIAGGTLNMTSNRIINLQNPENDQDAATRKYVDIATNDISTTTSLNNALNNGTMPNNPTIADAGSSAANQRVIFTSATSGRATLMNDSELLYNPSTNTLFVNGKVGVGTTTALNANASLDVTGNAIMRNSVAIGSTNIPSAPLDVTGNAIMRNSVAIGSSNSPSAPLDVTGSAKITGSLDIYNTNDYHLRLFGPSNKQFTFGVNSNDSLIWNQGSHNISFGTNNIERMRIMSNGRVGVGVNIPEVSLHVMGDNSEQNVVIDNTSDVLYSFSSHTFDNATATGKSGPTLTQCRTAYSSVSWAQDSSYLNMQTAGIQIWTVPATGSYTITAAGAASSTSGGRGKIVSVIINLTKNEQISILVGQMGLGMSGGGGGTFVYRNNTSSYIVVGGGGGGNAPPPTILISDPENIARAKGGDAQFATSGGPYRIRNAHRSGLPGTNGTQGGAGYSPSNNYETSSRDGGAGGAGVLSNGTSALGGTSGGKAFINGGGGGEGLEQGGFGGGGGAVILSFTYNYGYGYTETFSKLTAGGGGGYSGGGGGISSGGDGDSLGGEGGGSYGVTTLTDIGYRSGHGYVTITANFTVNVVTTVKKKVTALFDNGFAASSDGFVTKSDKRIKTDIIKMNTSNELDIFRKLQPVKHGYIDKSIYGYMNKYGFIAQEVQQILPEAILSKNEVIPSIYNKASVIKTENIILNFDKPIKEIEQFKFNTKLKCYDNNNNISWVTIKQIIDEYKIEIEEDIVQPELFIYGHKVDDFLYLDKDTIWTVATAALQEVDRQQIQNSARISELETIVSEQQTIINNILDKVNKSDSN